jgi:hypothetical protein
MSNPFERVQAVWDRLKKSDLVKGTKCEPQDFIACETLLNLSIPVTEREINYTEVIRNLYRKDSDAFIEYLVAASSPELSLLCSDSRLITKCLGIESIAVIHWNQNTQKYIVRRTETSYEPHTPQPPPSGKAPVRPKKHDNKNKYDKNKYDKNKRTGDRTTSNRTKHDGESSNKPQSEKITAIKGIDVETMDEFIADLLKEPTSTTVTTCNPTE